MLLEHREARIAFNRIGGIGPEVMFCGGFRSNMAGTKALALEAHCAAAGRACTRFDYRGHGESDGAFTDGTIGGWLDDSLAVLDQVARGPVVLVGSSMGAWIALLAARSRPDRIKGMVLVAPAVDFTEALIWERLPTADRATLERDGVWLRKSDYVDDPDRITLRLIEEGRNHLLFGQPIPFDGPVRILHGMEDETVPWQFATRTAESLTAADVIVTLVKGGDHRLSDEENLSRLMGAVDEVAESVAS
ncbi:MAG: alpha/beta hydrolase [Proteobacteria bacterium]|nr:alpha/beta hydrolase [Pseudomonadota bacterium]